MGAPCPLSFNAPTPRDAYRQGLINRWELEQLTGPEPQRCKGQVLMGRGGIQTVVAGSDRGDASVAPAKGAALCARPGGFQPGMPERSGDGRKFDSFGSG